MVNIQLYGCMSLMTQSYIVKEKKKSCFKKSRKNNKDMHKKLRINSNSPESHILSLFGSKEYFELKCVTENLGFVICPVLWLSISPGGLFPQKFLQLTSSTRICLHAPHDSTLTSWKSCSQGTKCSQAPWCLLSYRSISWIHNQKRCSRATWLCFFNLLLLRTQSLRRRSPHKLHISAPSLRKSANLVHNQKRNARDPYHSDCTISPLPMKF